MNIRVALIVLCTATLAILSGINCAPSSKQGNVPNNQLPVIVSFTADPVEIVKGAATTLAWETSGASNITIDVPFPLNELPAKGKIMIGPISTVTYTLTASNGNGSVNQSVTVKVNPASNTSSQSSLKPDSGASTARPVPQSQTFCRDGLCTFTCEKLFSIDYPDSWKVISIRSDNTKSVDLFSKSGAVGLMDFPIIDVAPKDAVSYSSGVTIMTNNPNGQIPLNQVADQYIKYLRSGLGDALYVADNRATTGVWDWFIDYSFSMGAPTRHIRVYYKSTDIYLYELRAYATRDAFQSAVPFTSDFDKIIYSFKLQQ